MSIDSQLSFSRNLVGFFRGIFFLEQIYFNQYKYNIFFMKLIPLLTLITLRTILSLINHDVINTCILFIVVLKLHKICVLLVQFFNPNYFNI